MTIMVNGLLPQAIGADGWTAISESWAYASATTITVPSGATTRFVKGDRIKLTQLGSVAYFVVADIASSLLTITSGSSYTLSNNPISAVSYSHQVSPVGWPGYFQWTPGYTGFSANPTTDTGVLTIFSVVGNTVTVLYASTPGTSNTTGFTITGLPFTVLNGENRYPISGRGIDNNAHLLNPFACNISGTTLTLEKDASGATWTNTSTKGLYSFQLSYQF